MPASCLWCENPSPPGKRQLCDDCVKKQQVRHPDPTPEEIRQMAAEIREGWTDTEWAKRCTGRYRPVEVKEATIIIGKDGSEL